MTDVPGNQKRPSTGWYMHRNSPPVLRRWDGSRWAEPVWLPRHQTESKYTRRPFSKDWPAGHWLIDKTQEHRHRRQAGVRHPSVASGQPADLGGLWRTQSPGSE
jgi:hypothetical protein